MFKQKEVNLLYNIDEKPLIFMTAAFYGYYQQPFLIRWSASVYGSHENNISSSLE